VKFEIEDFSLKDCPQGKLSGKKIRKGLSKGGREREDSLIDG